MLRACFFFCFLVSEEAKTEDAGTTLPLASCAQDRTHVPKRSETSIVKKPTTHAWSTVRSIVKHGRDDQRLVVTSSGQGRRSISCPSPRWCHARTHREGPTPGEGLLPQATVG